MRIGIDARLGNSGGGISRYLNGLVSALVARAGADDQVIAFGAEPLNESEGVEFHKVDGGPARYYGWALSTAVRENRIDVLITGSAFEPFVLPCPTIAIVYDLYPLQYRRILGWQLALSPTAVKHTVRTFVHSVLIHRSSIIVAISEATRRDLLRFFPALQRKTIVLYPGADQRFHRGVDREEPSYLLYVGAFNEQKGIPLLLQAHEILNSRRRCPIQLVLAGQPTWPYLDMQHLLARYKNNVAVRVRPSDNDLIELYRGAQAFVYLSLYEGFGLPVLEAIRCGAPVLVHDDSSLPEIAPFAECRADGKNPFAVADALEKILLNRADLARRLELWSKRFSYGVAASELLEKMRRVARG